MSEESGFDDLLKLAESIKNKDPELSAKIIEATKRAMPICDHCEKPSLWPLVPVIQDRHSTPEASALCVDCIGECGSCGRTCNKFITDDENGEPYDYCL